MVDTSEKTINLCNQFNTTLLYPYKSLTFTYLHATKGQNQAKFPLYPPRSQFRLLLWSDRRSLIPLSIATVVRMTSIVASPPRFLPPIYLFPPVSR